MSSPETDPDVVLHVEGERFPCHRMVLARKSPYFRAMFGEHFLERDKEVIEIQAVDPQALQVLINYAYKNEFEISSDIVFPLLQAASMLQFESVQKSCITYILQTLTMTSCLQTMCLADHLGLTDLFDKARRVSLWEFSKVVKTDTFFEMTIESLQKYLRSDALHVKNEFELFEAIVNWIEDDHSSRAEHLDSLLECIRFCEMSVSHMKTMLYYPLIEDDDNLVKVTQCMIDMKGGKLKEDNSNECIKIEDSDKVLHEESVIEEKKGKDSSASKKVKPLDVSCCNRFNCCVSAQDSQSDESSSEYKPNESRIQETCLYDAEIMIQAKEFLGRKPRTMPRIPCVVGHIKLEGEEETTIENIKGSDGRSIRFRDDRKLKSYLIYYDAKKRCLIPYLYLTKVHQGPVEATGYKVCAVGKDVYVIGGEYMPGYSNWNKAIWRYDSFREMWNFETSLQNSRRHHSVCVFGDAIYLIGGFGRHRVILDKVERYNTSSGDWFLCAPLPTPLYSAACCVHQRHMYVIGSLVYYYHPESDLWKTLHRVVLPNNLGFSSAISHESCIYLTSSYSTELMRFWPDKGLDRNEIQNLELVGHFKQKPQNTCLVEDIIYTFSCDDGNLFIESYNIPENKFEMVWTGTADVRDFSPKYSHGCFPLIKY